MTRSSVRLCFAEESEASATKVTVLESTNAEPADGYAEASTVPVLNKPSTLQIMSMELSAHLKGSDVLILRLPPEILTYAEVAGVSSAADYSELERAKSSGAYRDLEALLDDYISDHFITSPAAGRETNGISIHPPGLRTVTRGIDEKFIGMHVDSWDRDPVARRHRSANRISINLASEARTFLFLVNTLQDCYEEYSKGEGAHDTSLRRYRQDPDAFVRRYFTSSSGLAIVGVQIPPGCAYVAPTENLIHDATTYGRSCSDVALTIRGHLQWKKPIYAFNHLPRRPAGAQRTRLVPVPSS